MKRQISQALRSSTGKKLLVGFVFVFIAIMHLSANGVSLQNARALSAFNTDPLDAPTVQSFNESRFPGTFDQFAVATDANADEVVTVVVSYHNSASEDAQNVKVALVASTASANSVTVDGRLWADNFNESSGQSVINLSSTQSISYIPGSAQWYPDQSHTSVPFPFGQTGDEILGTEGVNLGDIVSGSQTQGIVTAQFKVSNDIVVPPVQFAPAASTLSVTSNGAQGTRTLAPAEAFGVEWISSNVTSCDLSMDGQLISGVTENGSLGPISSSHPFYPAAGSSKTFSVTCIGLSGSISGSVIVTRPLDPQAPVAPVLSGTMSSVCGGIIELSWNSVTGATAYKLSRDGNVIATITGTSYTDSGLTPSTAYTYTVVASNTVADSASSNSISVTSSNACGNGGGGGGTSTLQVTSNGISVQHDLTAGELFGVEWISSNVTSCDLFVDNVLSSGVTENGNLGPISSTHPFYPAAGGYRDFKVTCQGLSGLISDTVRVTLPAAPLVPEVPTLTASTSSQCGGLVDLSWTATVNATSYKIYRGSILIATTQNTSFTETGLIPGTQYSYTVKASNTVGDSANSNTASATASAACSQGTSTLQVTSNGISVQHDLTAGELFGVEWISSNVTSCDLFVDNVLSSGVTENGNLGPISSTHPFYPAAGGYRDFKVTCQGLSGLISDTVRVTLPAAPIAPEAPIISAVTGTQCGGTIFVSWTLVQNATAYKVFRGGIQVATTTNLSFTDTGLTPNQAYSYTVKATNGVLDSVFSNTHAATASSACVNPPAAPVLVAQTGLQCGGNISLSWNSVAGATSYKIIRDGNVIASNITEITYTDSPLVPGSSHTYSVIAKNSAGSSANSNQQTVVASAKCPLPEPTVSLTANPDTINKGQNSTLTWSSTNTTSCSAPWTQATSTSGSFVVSPAQTTNYSIVCTNGVDSVSATTTVTVKTGGGGDHKVTVTLTANPSTIFAGATSTLVWNANSKATNCSAPWTTATSTTGSQQVRPATTTTYSITCSNSSSSATATATVTVVPVQECLVPTFTSGLSAQGKIGEAFSYTLAANSHGTSTVSYSVATGSLPAGLSFEGNTISGTPTQSGTFSVAISATNTCGSTEQTLVITIGTNGGGGGNPITVSLVANPSTIFAGATSTLTWTSSNTTFCGASWTSATSTSGSQVVGPATTTSYAITCSNANASSTATATIVVVTGPQCIIPIIDSALSVSGTVNSAFSYTLTSNSSTSTVSYVIATSTLPAGLSVSGNTITGTPTQTGTFAVSISASNVCGSDTDTLVITINPQSTGGGSSSGGGGSSASGSRHHSVPAVLGVVADCEYLRDYLRIGWNNDPIEVIKLQVFLKELEDFKNLQITGVFDQATFDAVSEFQVRYQPDILTPWGYAQGEYTGYVYILTKKKVNEIFCQKAYPVNAAQQDEINQFNAFLKGLKDRGVSLPGSVSGSTNETPSLGNATSTLGSVGFVPSLPSTNTTVGSNGLINNERVRNAAAAIFAGPQGLVDAMKSVAFFILALLVLYGIADAVTRLQNRKGELTAQSVRTRKIFTFIFGLILVIVLCFVFQYYAIILPFILLLIILSVVLLWISFRTPVASAQPITPAQIESPVAPIILGAAHQSHTPNVEPITSETDTNSKV